MGPLFCSHTRGHAGGVNSRTETVVQVRPSKPTADPPRRRKRKADNDPDKTITTNGRRVAVPWKPPSLCDGMLVQTAP